MKKITKEAVNAFINNFEFKSRNTKISINKTKISLILHENTIAYKVNNKIFISSCGWATSTTRERLNGLLSTLKKGKTFIKNGKMFYQDLENNIAPLNGVKFTKI